MLFRIKTRIIDLKANFKRKPAYRSDGWKCEGCREEVEANIHVLICRAYNELRNVKDLKESEDDLVAYFKEVIKLRMKKMKV